MPNSPENFATGVRSIQIETRFQVNDETEQVECVKGQVYVKAQTLAPYDIGVNTCRLSNHITIVDRSVPYYHGVGMHVRPRAPEGLVGISPKDRMTTVNLAVQLTETEEALLDELTKSIEARINETWEIFAIAADK